MFRISFDLGNAGRHDGEEVVQLYTHDVVASRVRPIKELKHFARVPLGAGESRTVRLELPARELALHDDRMQLVVEPGEFEILIGASSTDIRLKGSIRVE